MKIEKLTVTPVLKSDIEQMLQSYQDDDDNLFRNWSDELKSILAEDMWHNYKSKSLHTLSVGDDVNYFEKFLGRIKKTTLVVINDQDNILTVQDENGGQQIDVIKDTGVNTQGPDMGWIKST